ncbi:MAG: hypothetical protein LBF67_06955 [Prevotellaceae bacterium]|jgi:hypothetical protein|nr:hypothetical protein [Prevotellaceae bacterium]
MKANKKNVCEHEKMFDNLTDNAVRTCYFLLQKESSPPHLADLRVIKVLRFERISALLL